MEISDLAGIVGSVSSSENAADLSCALSNAAKIMGMAGFNLSLLKLDPREFMTAPTLTDWDAAALAEYQRVGWSDRDPLLRYAGSDGKPRMWKTTAWLNDPQFHDYCTYLHEVEVAGGITIPLREKSNKYSAVTMISARTDVLGRNSVQAAFIICNAAKLRLAAFGSETSESSMSIKRLRSLSSRQKEIIAWIAKGKSNYEIGIILGLNKRTVDYHVREVLSKLCVRTRAEAAAVYAAH